jgi:CHAT domain-containing protein
VTTSQETARLFGPDEAFVSYFVHGEAVSAFVVVRGELHVARVPVAASALRAQVEQLVKLVRSRPQPGQETAWLAGARALHANLIAPIEPRLANVKALFVSPHGFLANLPFGVLADRQGRLLIETRRLTYVPSTSVYRQLLSRPITNRAPRMLAVGNAIYPAGVSQLAFAEKEALTVSEMFPDGRLLRGEVATEAKVAELAPTYNILHFATHGVLLGRVVPGGSSLLVTADDAHDGFLSATEIAGLDLSKSYIAVLSACETSVSEATGSIDLGTMTNAFLTAGAPSVVGTLWQVDDVATTALMLEFYQQFLEVGAGEALRRAQLALRKDPSRAHPYYWAAFTLFGWDK